MFMQNLLPMPQKLFIPLRAMLQMVAELTTSAVRGRVAQMRETHLKLLFLVSHGPSGRTPGQEEQESK